MDTSTFTLSTLLLFIVAALVAGMLYGCPKYEVYSQRHTGMAELQRAESNKRIAIQEAQARLESAELLSKAEVARAHGVAEANKIIGESLKGNEAYLRYLWIIGLQDTQAGHTTVYVPTEAGLPILEAGRFSQR